MLITENVGHVELENWSLVNANVPTEYNVKSFIECGRNVLDQGIFKPIPTIYLMEKQTLRPLGKTIYTYILHVI